MIKAIISKSFISLHDEHENTVATIGVREEKNLAISLTIELEEERELNIHVK